MADLNTPAGQLGNAIGGVGGGMQGVSKDIQARMELQDNLRRYFGQADIFGGEAFFDDLEKGADFRLMKIDHGGSHVVKIGRGDTGHQVSVDNQRFNKWNAQNKATAAAGTVAPSATRSSVPVAAPDVANTNANKVIPLADGYDTGSTAAKVASGETISNPPPTAPSKAADVDLSKLSDEELAASKARLEKELRDLDAEAIKTEKILAEARGETGKTTSPKPKGPSGLGAPADIKSKPTPHGVAITPPTVPPPAPPGPSAPPGPPTTSPTAPTAKIVTNTQGNNLTAREALRGIGDDIKAARKPGQRLLSADGSKAMAEAVTRGIKGSRNLKMLAVGSALGLGGYTANRVTNRDNPLDLEG